MLSYQNYLNLKGPFFYAGKLLEEIMAKVERRELPDAAETEANWSSVVTTDPSSHCGDIHEGASHSAGGCAQSDSDANEGDAKQRTKGDASEAVGELQHKARKTLPCEGTYINIMMLPLCNGVLELHSHKLTNFSNALVMGQGRDGCMQ